MRSKPSPSLPVLQLSTTQTDILSPLNSLTPRGIREMIHIPSAEHLWRVMHSNRTNDSFPANALPPRPSLQPSGSSRPTTSISSLTARENLRLGKRLDTASAPMLSSQGTFLRPSTGPNDMDFKRVLERLNRIVVQGGTGMRKMVLTDEKPVDILLDENETIYIRIPTHQQPCPLHVTLKRSRGRLLSFVSRTSPEPSETICDASFKGDSISFSDPSPKFRSKNVFLSLQALEDVVVNLKLTFGRIKPALKLALTQNAEEFDWASYFATSSSPRSVKAKAERNFVELNQQVLTPSMQALTEKREAMNARKAEVLKRFRENLSLKRTKALNVINKREIQRQERLRQQREADAKAQRDKFNKKWLALVTYSVFFDEIQAKMEIRKAELAAERLKNRTARKIQRRFRAYAGSSVPMIALARCQHSLLLITHLVAPCFAVKTTLNIVKSIRESKKNASIRKSILIFYKKSKRHVVLFLQSRWRDALALKKRHFDRLLQTWNHAFTLFIDSLGKKKQSRKGKRGKDTGTARYFAISPTVRLQVLSRYFNEQRLAFRTTVKKYLEDKKMKIAGLPPVFQMEADEETLRKLIEKAADISEQFTESA